MEVVLGALPSLLPKLGELLADEYNLQKEVKGGIMFLQAELESMKAALEDISETPPDKLPSGDKIWAKNVRELSYDIEDNIDTFMVEVKGHQLAEKKHSFKKFIEKILGFSLMQPKIRRKIAIDIRDIKSRVREVHDRRCRYKVKYSVAKPNNVDPRALVLFEDVTKLVGIDDARDNIIKILMEGNKDHSKIISIVGFGGLGKTSLANVVYKKLGAQFDCSAIISVSRTPDMVQLLKDIFYKLDKKIFKEHSIKHAASLDVIINELKNFLQQKRCFIIIDDIWEISHWNIIRCALPENNDGYRIITTTRNVTIAEQIGSPYKMKPLSSENSKLLMYGRIFGEENKDKCPDKQLEGVLNKILKKCDGVPLAIITIASLLAIKGRNTMEWHNVCNSIGDGLEKDNKNMRNVLSLSYYDMPSHLRTCLLYFSMFPEDYDIEKERLIWLWIAEGFIQPGKQEKSLFETGEGYFNELINRSMIQPRHDIWSGMIESCRVHDMVLDFIRNLSSEENFTVWNDLGHSSASEKIRRLSLQKGKVARGKPEVTLSMEHVRSVIDFRYASVIDFRYNIHHVSILEGFRVLRVLDLEGCYLSKGYSLKYLGNLLHLRYLGLKGTLICQLPEEIGNLQFLQTLNVDENDIPSLPPAVVQLKQLMCLRTARGTSVPKGIGSLTALEELSFSGQPADLIHITKELGHLRELRVLEITIVSQIEWNKGLLESLVECLSKLHKIQSIKIRLGHDPYSIDGWVVVAPQHLRCLKLDHSCWFSTLPSWVKVDPSLLVDLSVLEIRVKVLRQEDLEILGRLPALCFLRMTIGYENLEIQGRFTIGACSFPRLVRCEFYWGFGGPVVIEQGAMPRLEYIWLNITVQGREIDGDFDMGLGNLLSLHEVVVVLEPIGDVKEEVAEEAEAAVRQALEVHPNHPKFKIFIFKVSSFTVVEEPADAQAIPIPRDQASDPDAQVHKTWPPPPPPPPPALILAGARSRPSSAIARHCPSRPALAIARRPNPDADGHISPNVNHPKFDILNKARR